MPYERLKLAQKKTVGLKQTLKACHRGNVECVYIATDAEANVTAPVQKLCQEKSIAVVKVKSMRDLGKACGIEVACAVAAAIK
ncbi:putative ribosomal protein L7Ae-like protein [Desulfofarcimen acetoxidans DSM 771]|jgi:large subunit ribosomal protein L7A|uniref:Putative ribosomal protein L7Ae-like protein n=1 Tax=Desulfofarcimen acetoxidans (strain ATCC 49208 / DSM 771 / KCTC 5769 / VKM B-1644 / 5575) TaxID=485916 RepID=C8W3X9_DESAS|nr:ribosomal L7Ae/L30e/S12e/Gadd45 family protein [Desulfofarcimen acetoxidans]ACV61233.1 putative ribosomal protein L7Ae-like protein [Desulfofarcimen acetoxidans DSM 771]